MLCDVGEVVMRDDKLFGERLVLLHLINLMTTNYVIYFPAVDTAIIIIHIICAVRQCQSYSRTGRC